MAFDTVGFKLSSHKIAPLGATAQNPRSLARHTLGLHGFSHSVLRVQVGQRGFSEISLSLYSLSLFPLVSRSHEQKRKEGATGEDRASRKLRGNVVSLKISLQVPTPTISGELQPPQVTVMTPLFSRSDGESFPHRRAYGRATPEKAALNQT
ncbi:uncharacterized protein J3R85_009682 [Psidium guajava]|nr:uncharacterized protein J3R85_009682 [Psidium guajava]